MQSTLCILSSLRKDIMDGEAIKSAMQKLSGSKAFIVGYSGEVGKELTKCLLQHKLFKQLVLIGRRRPETEDSKIEFVEVADFDKLDEHAVALSECTVGYCCLGTTRGKAGKDGFYKVDHDYVVKCAELAKARGCQQFHLISSSGANEKSYFLYNKTKGEAERDCAQLGLPSLSVYRPAFLLCDRAERRLGERVALATLKPITYAMPTAISVPTVTVAKAMVYNTIQNAVESADGDQPRTSTITNTQIHDFGGKLDELQN